MGPLALLAIGAAVGLAKSELVDRPKEKRQRKLAAETQRLSPWTGMQAGPIQEADPLGSALSFGMTGAQLGMGMQQAALNEKIADRIGGSGYTPINVSASTGTAAMGNPYAGALLPQAYQPNPFGTGLANPYGGMAGYGY